MKRFYLSFDARHIPNYTRSENHGSHLLEKRASACGLDTEFDDRAEAERAAEKLEEECGEELGRIYVEDRQGPGLHE